MKKPIRWVLLLILIVAIAIQAIPLIKIEILTAKYYDDFEYAYSSNTMLGEMSSFKVLECDGKEAKVYYISKDKGNGDILSFSFINNEWVETGWRTLWSTTGSADDLIWPYWWHFIYSTSY